MTLLDYSSSKFDWFAPLMSDNRAARLLETAPPCYLIDLYDITMSIILNAKYWLSITIGILLCMHLYYYIKMDLVSLIIVYDTCITCFCRSYWSVVYYLFLTVILVCSEIRVLMCVNELNCTLLSFLWIFAPHSSCTTFLLL